jgi:hypothetical protein
MRRYDSGYRRSGRARTEQDRYAGDYGRYFTPDPGDAGYPSARWGWGPIGWAGTDMVGMGLWPGAGGPRGETGREPPRRDPRESRAYGRGGDRELRRWAQRYGYDFDHTIRPRD